MVTVKELLNDLFADRCSRNNHTLKRVRTVLESAKIITPDQTDVRVSAGAMLFAIGRTRPKRQLAGWENVVAQIGTALVPYMNNTMPGFTEFGIKRKNLSRFIGCGLHYSAMQKNAALGSVRDRYLHPDLILHAMLLSGKTSTFVDRGVLGFIDTLLFAGKLQVTVVITDAGAVCE